ncbi:hypothetical protein BP6252_11961 [Coleophoma cylindrospora]|uniref:Zn(2)-C6 fungal-type domain-containing protein n=1 Tax=Coleophoma cylindrospora TaxID=1849047 RepID=A0A3D8QFW3_9HELO|nr:hypothetical protein BP6252_11961 [Coleophoma cylindrospora]
MEVDRVGTPGGNDPPALTGPPAPRRKRAPVACRRCRRLRSKCVHESSVPPCELCKSAGEVIAASCVFLSRNRGDGDHQIYVNDREYRQRRRNIVSSNTYDYSTEIGRVVENDIETSRTLAQWREVVRPQINLSPPLSVGTTVDPNIWSILPPFNEVVEGCRTFFTSCFQLGFLPKAIFLERLITDPKSMNVFLLASILSVSARFTKCLVRRYGDTTKATDYFINRAGDMIINEIYNPSLERTQSFFLLGVSEWVQGNRTRSAMHMGIAVRMAGIQHLHREESYAIPHNAATEDIINLEAARRTFWVLESQDHLYAEHNAAVSFPPSDITALLPSDEIDFAYGTVPRERAAIGNTQAAIKDPTLVSLPSRSPFATLIQAHTHWGEIARRAGRASKREREKADEKVKPWESKSEYSQLTTMLKEWEEKVPERHRWSLINLRGHKAEYLDLAYLSQVMVVRINNIVIRRIYLEDILESKVGTSPSEYGLPEFWDQMSHELFTNVHSLHESIDAWFSLRAPDEGIPSIVVFCVYICGSLASHLWKWPQLCPELADMAEAILNRSLEVLAALIDQLPHASRWLSALRKSSVLRMPRNISDCHEQPLQTETGFGSSMATIPTRDIENQTSQVDRRLKERQVDHHTAHAAGPDDPQRASCDNRRAKHRLFNYDPERSSLPQFNSSTITDDISLVMENSRTVDGVYGISGLESSLGYDLDDELMHFL